MEEQKEEFDAMKFYDKLDELANNPTDITAVDILTPEDESDKYRNLIKNIVGNYQTELWREESSRRRWQFATYICIAIIVSILI